MSTMHALFKALASYLSKCLVEPHLLSQYGDIVEKVRLHVAPHVWKPPEVSLVLQQHVITLILLIGS